MRCPAPSRPADWMKSGAAARGRRLWETAPDAQVDTHADPGLGAVRDGARHERHERRDLADRGRPRHDHPGCADRDHPLHAGDGGVHVARREARRHPRPQPRLRDRPGDLRGRLAHHVPQPQPRRAAGWLVGDRGVRRSARDPRDRRPYGRLLRGTRPRGRLRPAGWHRRGRHRGRAADRWLGDDGVHLALRVRRRDRGRDRDPARPRADRSGPRARAAPAARRRRGGAVVGRPRADRVRDPAQQRLGVRPAAHPTDDRRHRDHPARLLAGAVPGAGRTRATRGLRHLGAAACPPRTRPAARHDAAAGDAAARRAFLAARTAIRSDGNLLRHPRLPAGRGGPGRLRDRQTPAAALAGDAYLRPARAPDGRRGDRHAPSPSWDWSRSASARW